MTMCLPAHPMTDGCLFGTLANRLMEVRAVGLDDEYVCIDQFEIPCISHIGRFRHRSLMFAVMVVIDKAANIQSHGVF